MRMCAVRPWPGRRKHGKGRRKKDLCGRGRRGARGEQADCPQREPGGELGERRGDGGWGGKRGRGKEGEKVCLVVVTDTPGCPPAALPQDAASGQGQGRAFKGGGGGRRPSPSTHNHPPPSKAIC